MTLLIILAAVFCGIKAFKQKNPVWASGAAALLYYGLWYWRFGEIFAALNYIIYSEILTLAVIVAVTYGVTWAVFGKMKHEKAEAAIAQETGTLQGMSLLVGRILDTRSKDTVFTDVSIGRDVFGGLEATTSHEVQVSHSTWLQDLTTGKEVHYAGSGELRARAGHILGTMSWRGKSLIDINFSTEKVYTVQAVNPHPIASAFWAGALMVFGWALFPLFVLMSPLVWLGLINWRNGSGAYIDTVAPGTHRLEAIMTYGGALAYAITLYQLFSHHNGSFNPLPIIVILFAVLFGLHQFVVRAARKRQIALIETGKSELGRIYREAADKQASQHAAQTPAPAPAPGAPAVQPAV